MGGARFPEPHLFRKECWAKAALREWLKGRTTVRMVYSGEWEGDEDWKTVPIPSRVASNMEVVRIKLEVIASV